MYATAERIVTVGEGYRDRLLAKGVASERISIVMNGVDRELFRPNGPDSVLFAQLGLGGRFVVSYSGTIGMACGLEVVLDAAEALRRQRIVEAAGAGLAIEPEDAAALVAAVLRLADDPAAAAPDG